MPNRKTYKRNRKQLWLYYNLESQGRTYCSSHYDTTELDDWFNVTATFKTDSDLVADYKEFRSFEDIFSNKKYVDAFNELYVKSDGDPIRVLSEQIKTKKYSYCRNLSFFFN
jgi:hypothetical protein